MFPAVQKVIPVFMKQWSFYLKIQLLHTFATHDKDTSAQQWQQLSPFGLSGIIDDISPLVKKQSILIK